MRPALLPTLFPALALLGAAPAASSQESDRKPELPRYVPVDLGSVPGWTHLRTFDVNDRLQVTGTLVGGSGQMAFVWLPRPALGLPAGMSTLGTLPLGDLNASSARAIDNCGRIVGLATGYTSPSSTVQRAFLWQNGVMHDLGSLTGRGGGATAVNRRGVVVGWSLIQPRSTLRAFSTRVDCGDAPSGGLVDLGSLADTWSSANAVNDAGQVVGNTALPVPPLGIFGAPFFYDARNGMVELPFLPGTSTGFANALNNRGVVVGYCLDTSGSVVKQHAALWRRTKGTWSVADLAQFDGAPLNTPTAIDEKDRVVGATGDSLDPDSRGYLWIQGVYHALDDLLVTSQPIRITQTGGINGRGDIAASGLDAQGEFRGFLLVRVR